MSLHSLFPVPPRYDAFPYYLLSIVFTDGQRWELYDFERATRVQHKKLRAALTDVGRPENMRLTCRYQRSPSGRFHATGSLLVSLEAIRDIRLTRVVRAQENQHGDRESGPA